MSIGGPKVHVTLLGLTGPDDFQGSGINRLSHPVTARRFALRRRGLPAHRDSGAGSTSRVSPSTILTRTRVPAETLTVACASHSSPWTITLPCGWRSVRAVPTE